MTEPSSDAQIARDPNIEEISNRLFIHPISDWLASKLAGFNVHPNWVSFAGLICGIIASFCYYQSPSTEPVIWGFVFMVLWHIFDGADGHLARLTNKASAIGKIIDGIADYSVFGAVYIALALLSTQTIGNAAWYLLFGAVVSHIIQSATYERQREIYRMWVFGKTNDDANSDTKKDQDEKPALSSAASILNGLYQNIQNILTQHSMTNEHLNTFNQLSDDKKEKVRTEFRRRFAPQIQLWTLLSANLHTLALFLFTLYGEPWSYFQFEIIGLNLLLVALILHQRKMNSNFIRWMGENS